MPRAVVWLVKDEWEVTRHDPKCDVFFMLVYWQQKKPPNI
jgi:hypothetical protein